MELSGRVITSPGLKDDSQDITSAKFQSSTGANYMGFERHKVHFGY